MNYDGKFRDFMIGWLADQLDKSSLPRDQSEALYDQVTDADDDKLALLEVSQILGSDLAARLWCLSQLWQDPRLDQAQALLGALRDRVQEDYHDPPAFYLFFLNPFKTGCVPESFSDNLEREIIWMFQTLYGSAADMALAAYGWRAEVVVEPSYDDASYITLLAHPQGEPDRRVFLFNEWRKAWQVRFCHLAELAHELTALQQRVEACAYQAILSYRVAEMMAEVLNGFSLPVALSATATQPGQNQPQVQSLPAFADRVSQLVTDLNGLTRIITNEELTLADFDGDLTPLFQVLVGVEVAVKRLTAEIYKR